MTNNDLPATPNPEWPEEVKKAYESLKIPSIYDCVMANEKLSLELHKQTRQIKSLVEGIQGVSSQLNTITAMMTEEIELEEDEELIHGDELRSLTQELEDLEDRIKSHKYESSHQDITDILMDVTDQLTELTKNTKTLTSQLMEVLPRTTGWIPRVPSWYKLVEEIVSSLSGGIENTRYGFVAKLADLNISMIEPESGDSFISLKHRVLERLKGGEPGTIARLVKVGYQQGDQVLRLAEVVVYH